MKKTIIFLNCAWAAAQAAPYYLPTPPGGGLTPGDWQPHWVLEGLYAIGTRHTPDTWGFRSGFQLYSNGNAGIRHEFTLSAAPQWGDGHRYRHSARARQNIFQLPLTGGYTLNLGVTDSCFLYLGGKAGWAVGHYREKSPLHRESGSYNGFTFSAGGGLKFQCSERLYFQTGYEYSRTYTNTRHDDIWGQHIISAGLSWRF